MNINDFEPFTLSVGSHDDPSKGMCVMEMVSFLAGEEWSDTPPCSSPVVSRFCQGINDDMGPDVRARLHTLKTKYGIAFQIASSLTLDGRLVSP